MSQTMPSFFIGHGSPMNLVLDNSFTQALETLSTELPLPKAILVISAHWYTDQTAVSVASGITYETIYDFYGFPGSLYEMTYASPSNNTLSKHIAELLGVPTLERGLDHGAWMPLRYLFPKASVPVIQLSINKNLPFSLHVKIGEQLQTLRNEGVMIMGSGNLTHNLGLVDFYNIDAPVVDWAKNVDAFVQQSFLSNDVDSLVHIESLCRDFRTAHPFVDHYLPLLYIAGTRLPHDKTTVLTPLFQNASLSMKGFMFS
ncbi:MAG: dioxygenase [Sulfurospirillum cavolei]|nr:dioxygenase [Sulfurospirillum cavolei]